ncbi:MAG: SLBB domain-containing protein [Fimbriimonadaceae bacterium]|nr:SLBB domain-containing protein [Fimbriimonadaceae bacterium]
MLSRFAALLLVLLIIVSGTAFAQTANQTLRAGDKIRVVCEEEPSVSKDYTLSQDGTILMVFLGVVDLKGLTSEEAARKIAAQLETDRIVRRATVTVTLLTPSLGRVSYGGAARNTSETELKANTRLSDVIALARPLPDADMTRVQIRSQDGTIRLIDTTQIDETNRTHDPLLRDGDQVTFMLKVRGATVVVLGGVNKPGIIEMQDGLTVAEAIELAGGYSAIASNSEIRLERAGESERRLNLNIPTQANFLVMAGDRLIVETSTVRRYVRVEGGVQNPGPIPYSPGLTLMQAIQAAGGVTRGADTGRITIEYPDGRTRPVNFTEIADGYSADVPLNADDKVIIGGGIGRRSVNDDLVTIAIGLLIFLLLGS